LIGKHDGLELGQSDGSPEGELLGIYDVDGNELGKFEDRRVGNILGNGNGEKVGITVGSQVGKTVG